jgi:hypothetical protein
VTLIARFKVDGFEPRQVAGLDADWFGLLTFAKTFTSGITGTATTLFMSAGTEERSTSPGADGHRPFRLPMSSEPDVAISRSA